MNARTKISTGALLAVFAITLSGCSTPATPVSEETTSSPKAEASASATAASPSIAEESPSAEAPTDPMADAFAERDQFMIDQQQSAGQSSLTAKTPAQLELVAQQKAWVESQGGAWSAEAETLLLAVSLDACETSILNYHDVTQSVYDMHVATSPIFQNFATDAASLDGLSSMMVFGTSFICPDDSPQWDAGWQAARAAG